MKDNKKTNQSSQDDSNIWDKDVNLEDLQEKIDKLKNDEQQLDEQEAQESADDTSSDSGEDNEKYARLLAEFDNYKKRTREESARLMNMWAIWILKVVVSFFEDFNRAAQQCPEEIKISDFWKWICLIVDNFIWELEKKWLKKIEALKEKFDATKMEALMQDPNISNEQVAKVLEEWFEYEWGIVKIAKVIVWSKK